MTTAKSICTFVKPPVGAAFSPRVGACRDGKDLG